MPKIHITTTINGDATEYLCEPEQTLLDVLRDELNMTGSKEGCSSGDCGACSVMGDGRLVCSCLVMGAEAEGREVETIEGMADYWKESYNTHQGAGHAEDFVEVAKKLLMD